MKAEERHGLKTNELAQWILSLPQLIKENLQMIIYVSAAAVLIVLAAFYYFYQKKTTIVKNEENLTRLINNLAQNKMQILQAQGQGVDLSYNLIQTADELDTASQNLENDNAAALALIKRAEALRMELHYRPGVVSKETLTSQINLAKTSYEKAITKVQGTPALTAKAKYGLGLCEEELGNFAAAEKIYHEIINTEDFAGTTGFAEARHRLATITDYEKPVTFKPAPQPIQSAAVSPIPPGPRIDVPAVQPSPQVNAPVVVPTPELKPADTNQTGPK